MFKQFIKDSSNIEIQEVSTLDCKGRGMYELIRDDAESNDVLD